MYTDDDTEFEFADEATEFEPRPWGSCQRILPRSTFKAAVTRPAAPRAVATAPALPVARIAPAFPSAPLAAPVPPAFPPLGVAYDAAQPMVRDRERYIMTERVPRVSVLAPKPSRLRRRLSIIAVPLAAVAFGGVLAFVFARPVAHRVEAASPLQQSLERADDAVHAVASVEQPPVAAQPAPVATKHRAAMVKPAHAAKRPVLAFDTSTPLGDLARRKR